MKACIYCGCTETRACRYVVEFEGGRQEISCFWMCLDPPVCSAPACREKWCEAERRMPLMIVPPSHPGRKIRGEGNPIAAPTYITIEDESVHGERTRIAVINGALADARRVEPHATSVRVAEWIDAYLTYWDRVKQLKQPRTP